MSAQAKTFTYPDLNFQCTTPVGWNCDHKIGDVVHAFSNDKSKCFCLKAYKYDLTRAQIQQAESGLIAELVSQGYTESRRAPLMLRGVSFDTFVFVENTSTQVFRLDEYVGVFQGFIYQFELSMYDGNPSIDPELKSIVDSFDFINRPAEPSSSSQGLPRSTQSSALNGKID